MYHFHILYTSWSVDGEHSASIATVEEITPTIKGKDFDKYLGKGNSPFDNSRVFSIDNDFAYVSACNNPKCEVID